MRPNQNVKVAVLLATHNGARFLEPQIASLKKNSVEFTLHWLDDNSIDTTQDVVRAAASSLDIELREWHQPHHQGIPGAYFQLLECVEADIYLFCDQDDIWQPGKIDATVSDLLPELASPVLCFSDPLMFKSDAPGIYQRFSEVMGARHALALQESRVFMPVTALGHTQGFTRPLRDLFLKHKSIARSHAAMHDSWMYLLAVASGVARMLPDAPTTLYRRHGGNFSDVYLGVKGNWIVWTWQLQKIMRHVVARQAAGFIMASPLLPSGPKMDELVELAGLVTKVDRRQSLGSMAHLLRRRAMFASKRWAVPFTIACLCSDAHP